MRENNHHKTVSKFFILPILLSAILFISIAELPYGFYTIMRIVVPLLSSIYLYFAYIEKEDFSLMMISNILIVIIWNPIFPVYLDKETWIIIDTIAALCEIGVAYWSYRMERDAK